jgi:hypothetical protein
MQEWNKGNKMIRQIGEKEDPFEYLKMSEARLRGMEELASTHITWFTHKNPYGCWICDLFALTQACLNTFREFLGPETEEKDTSIVNNSSSATEER